jgi:hypothetical protein
VIVPLDRGSVRLEPGHEIDLIDQFGTLLKAALLASWALGHFAVVALSLDTSLAGALAHLDAPIVLRRVVGLGTLAATLTVLLDLTAQALDRLQLPRPVQVVFGGVGANSLGQTGQTRQLLLPDLPGFCGRQTEHRPPERLLRVSGAVKT